MNQRLSMFSFLVVLIPTLEVFRPRTITTTGVSLFLYLSMFWIWSRQKLTFTLLERLTYPHMDDLCCDTDHYLCRLLNQLAHFKRVPSFVYVTNNTERCPGLASCAVCVSQLKRCFMHGLYIESYFFVFNWYLRVDHYSNHIAPIWKKDDLDKLDLMKVNDTNTCIPHHHALWSDLVLVHIKKHCHWLRNYRNKFGSCVLWFYYRQ